MTSEQHDNPPMYQTALFDVCLN